MVVGAPLLFALSACVLLRSARELAARWDVDVGRILDAATRDLRRVDGSLRFGVALLAGGDPGIQVPC